LRQVATSLSRAATASRSRGAFRPRFAVNFLNPPFRGRRECRASAAPAAACAMIVVERTRVSQVTPESPGIPRAMVLTAFLCALPGDRAFLPPSPAGLNRRLDTSVGVSGPHDFSVRKQTPSSGAPPASTASRPAFVTFAKRPSVGTGPNRNSHASTPPSSKNSENQKLIARDGGNSVSLPVPSARARSPARVVIQV
jgi:hypothetical protein